MTLQSNSWNRRRRMPRRPNRRQRPRRRKSSQGKRRSRTSLYGRRLGSAPVQAGKNWLKSPHPVEYASPRSIIVNDNTTRFCPSRNQARPSCCSSPTIIGIRTSPRNTGTFFPCLGTKSKRHWTKARRWSSAGKARERKIVLLAAPTESELIQLIRKTKLLDPNASNE